MPPPPPPQPPVPPPHHLLKKPTSLPDVIFTAFSLLVLFSTSPKPTSLFFIHNNNNNNNNKLSFPLYPRKFPKMSSPCTSSANPRSPGRLPPPFATPQSLSDWLKPRLAADLFGSWGVKPGTKNVHNLWLEITEGETSLADSAPPVRTVEVVVVRIVRNGGKLLLVESHQELSNGVVRHRGRPLSEKMKPGESVESAVHRAVKEELGLESLVKIGTLGSVVDRDDCNSNRGIHGIVRILPGSYVKTVEERASASYPGLPARYLLHTVEAEVEGLPDGEFCTEELDEYGDLDEGKNVADTLRRPSSNITGSSVTSLPLLQDLDVAVIESLPPEVVSEINDMYGGKLLCFISESKSKTINTNICAETKSCEDLGVVVRDTESLQLQGTHLTESNMVAADERF